jgi:spectinomycin phosphotransferase
VIVEHPGLPADRVGASVRAEWGFDVAAVEHLSLGAGAWHWRITDDDGPEWFATVDAVGTAAERQRLLSAYEATTRLVPGLPFAVPPVRTRDGRIAVDVAPGLLLSLTPMLEGTAGDGPLVDDAARAEVADLLGALHRHPRPRHLPLWRPRIGRHDGGGRDELVRCVRLDVWDGGPWSVPAGRMLADARPVVERAISRFSLLGGAVTGSADRWVVTHGEPHTGNLVRTPDGLHLVDWETVRLAPRERDLREVLGESEGNEPWFAYVAAGGRPEPLSPDTLELFSLEWHLSEVTECAVRFSRTHGDGADERRCFGDLEIELAELIAGWG